MKAFNCLSLPTLITEDGTRLSSLQSISYEFAKTVNLDLVLFGDEKSSTRSSVDRHFDIVSKSEEELTNLYQNQLATKTFMEGNHITIADLLAFCNFYGHMMLWSSEKKFANNCVFRWYNHMQNLTGVKDIWEGDYVSFPVKVAVSALSQKELKNLANKEKKAQAKAFREQTQDNVDKSEVQKSDKPAQKTEQKIEQKTEQKQQQNNNQEKKPKQAKGGKGGAGNKPKPKPGSDEDLFDKFSQLEIRIGELTEVWKHPDSEKLWCEKINMGSEEVRQIASGLQNFIPLDKMTGKVMVAYNLKPKSLGGFDSNGMVMCASLKTDGAAETIELCRPDDGTQVGERVYLDGLELEDTKLAFTPNALLGKLTPHLKTDAEGFCVFNGKKMRTKSGFLKVTGIKNGTVS